MDRYDELLREGHDLTWAGRYDAAAERYRQAIRLRPDRHTAYSDLGYVLMEAGRLEEALRTFLRAEELQPGDFTTLSRIGHIYGELGQTEAAAATFHLLADRFLAQRRPAEAVRAWQAVIRYDPDNTTALRRLAEAYRRGNRPELAAKALVALARIHQGAGAREASINCCEEALALEPASRDARALLKQLRSRRTGGVATIGAGGEAPDVRGEQAGPDEEAAHRALARMAEAFFEESEREDLTVGVDALRAQAIEYQTQGLYEEALRAYDLIQEHGYSEPEVLYNIGVLHRELMHYDEAIEAFGQVREDDDFALAANFAIGQCYQLQGRIDEALEYFIEAARIVDLQTVDREQADDMIRLYEGLAESFEAKGERARAEQYAQALSDFLSRKGWEDKLREVRHRLGTLTGGHVTLAELIEVSDSEAVLACLTASQQYAEQGLSDAALEECYTALTYAPYYLPVHLQIGELLAQQDRMRDAVEKFVNVAETYRIQGNPREAIRTYERALSVSPLAIQARSALIDLLISHGEIDSALEQYLQRADNYYQLARTERALEDLHEALRLAPRGSSEKKWRRRIYRKLADIYVQRLDWPRAASALETLLGLAPDDTDAAVRLADLYCRIDRTERAVSILEEVTVTLKEMERADEALRMWREIAALHPDMPAIQNGLDEQLSDM